MSEYLFPNSATPPPPESNGRALTALSLSFQTVL